MTPVLAPSGKIVPNFYKNVNFNPVSCYEKNPHLSENGAHELALSIMEHCTRFIINKFP